jgi:hypothetical protein
MKKITMRRLVEIVEQVLETEQEHEEESIYWPEDRDEWKRVVKQAKRELKVNT